MGKGASMTRDERLALMDRLQAESAESLLRIAEHEARARAGDMPAEWHTPDEVLRREAPRVIFKTKEDARVEPQAAFSEQQYAELEGLADEIAETTAGLQRRIAALERQLSELRGELRAGENVLPLRGGRNAA
jgi:hypothetical protein